MSIDLFFDKMVENLLSEALVSNIIINIDE